MAVCTFFGHRDCPWTIRPKLREVLVELIEHKNVQIFYVGNQGTFDVMAHSVLKELSHDYPWITYGVVLAYLPGKDCEDENMDDTMLPEGIETVPKRFAISWRNRWMLKRADYVVCYVSRGWGGAAQFLQAAVKAKKSVYNLATLSE